MNVYQKLYRELRERGHSKFHARALVTQYLSSPSRNQHLFRGMDGVI